MKLDVEIDTALNYTIYEKIGDLNYRPTSSMSFEEFKQYQDRQILKDYWQSRARAQDGESAVASRGLIPKIFISPILDRIFGGSYVELVPRGFVTLDFGVSSQRVNAPGMTIRQQRNTGFEFDQQINMSVVGKVGEKLQVTANFDNNNSFDFQNNMKVEYTGYKEDILQKLEIGNVSLPLNNTLIQGAQNLFGIKAKLQFGKLDVTAIATTQRGKTSSIDIGGGGPGGGGQGRPFEIIASNYDDNRHFFLGHFFRDHYEQWLRNLPQIYSQVIINRVEVYVLNRTTDTQTLRNIVAFTDLGEYRRLFNNAIIAQGPKGTGSFASNDNESNSLWNLIKDLDRTNIEAGLQGLGINMQNEFDYEKINGARKLSPTEFTFHPQLGYITLSRKLQNDEVLAVAYEYTYNGQVRTVGQLSDQYGKLDDEQSIFLKLLRPRRPAIRDNQSRIFPTWDLMMKNVYSLNVTQLSREGFQLRLIYRDDRTGIDNPQFQDGPTSVREKQLIEIFGLDRLNPLNDPGRDGNFDFVEGVTVNTATGQIIFPYLHPFGSQKDGPLHRAFSTTPALLQKYSYDTLYRTTKADAELFATKNKFWLKGLYNAGSAKEILVPGFGLSQGSVKLFAGGIPLVEGSDYTVDYTFGKVTILNESILSSGQNIEVQYEQSDPFAFQTRSLLGTRLDYHLNEDVNLGSTFLYYNERPIISRNQIGTEPARNMQYGFDFNINKKSRLLTRIVDAIPIIQTKEESSVNLTGEFAQLIPGTSNKVDGEGTAYIDDFETSATPYSLMNPSTWKLSSIPKDSKYDPYNGAVDNNLSGAWRAKMAWYQVDNQFYRGTGRFKPDNITDEDTKNHYVRGIGPKEIFKERQLPPAVYFENIFDIAYYPDLRGPYNYDPQFKTTGAADLRSHWAGITTAVNTEVDFDKANIEYIEFWMLNPFLPGKYGRVITEGRDVGKNNETGGKLVLHLGNVSEDVTRDGRHAFENGLPPSGDTNQAVQTQWGYTPGTSYLNNAFDNNASNRPNQDVGLDGMSDGIEKSASSPIPTELKNLEDPSSDNFRYFLDSYYDGRNAQILERYRDFNGHDGNTPVITGSDLFTPAGSTIPDNEDLNADNTLSTSEGYYQYTVNLKPADMVVGRGYIVDKADHTDEATGETVRWFLFRIPVRTPPYETVGNIEGFKSIKYLRMIATEFSDPVVMRMANFRMVGSRWRKYTGTLREDGVSNTTDFSNITVSVVSLEENVAGSETKSPYRVPPGINRDRDQTAANSRLLNEQSIQACVEDLEDGDARAIYKNLSVDLFNYGRVKMFLHAHSQNTEDGEVSAFLRMGTDFDQNYYEIEIPLKVTSPASFEGMTDRDVWPEENEIDLALSELYQLKAERDKNNFTLSEPYPAGGRVIGKHKIRIFGRPDLTSVQVLMIGIRNLESSDKKSHSLCIWANELRATDFNRTAGWAVSSTLSAKLADFATVNGAIRHTSFGFGGVSSKIFERTRFETTAYDVSATVNLDKLIPGNTGIKVPMFLGYQRETITPLYDPANPDMKLSDALEGFDSEAKRENYLKIVRDQLTTRSINFVNVRKVKLNPESKVRLWDIENWAFSYSYSDRIRTNFNTAEDFQQSHKGSVAYTFSPKETGIEPFKDSKSLSSPWIKVIKDFNVSFLPSNISVRYDLDRSFGRLVYRNSSGDGTFVTSAPNFLKYFTFNRTYSLRWNLSKNLSFEYSSRANAVIDEPDGELDSQEKRDSVMHNLKKFGRMKNFDQSVTVNYTLPLDKIPVTDWVGADYRYQVNYNWKAGPVNKPDSPNKDPFDLELNDAYDFKNTIQNSREQSYTGKLDMVKLYNKIKFLKDINTPKKQKAPTRPTTQRTQPVRAQQPDTLKTNTTRETPPLARGFFRTLMSLRSINGTYTLNEGTILPGFTETPKFMGMDGNWSSPGWSFVLGSQNPNIRKEAGEKGWLTTNSNLTIPFQQVKNQVINIRANVEPSADFKIQVDFRKEKAAMYQEIYRNIDTTGAVNFESQNPGRSGSYKISVLTINTAFNSSNGKVDSDVFREFEQNLTVIQRRFLTNIYTGSNEEEVSTTSQDVLIPAFIAAYTGKDANKVSLSPFPNMPMPNWRIDYTGLNKAAFFKDMFQSITLSNGYQSTYSVMNYSNSLTTQAPVENLELDRSIESYNSTYFGNVVDGNLQAAYVISQVVISEQFSPLIGINIRTKGRLSANFQYKTKRDLALNISNAQITELSNKDVVLELGYTKNNMRLPFKSQGRTIVLKNDVTFRMNFTISDSKTIQRRINELAVITNGNINIQLRPNITYVVNQKLNVQAYFERNVNEPQISSSPRRANTRFGIQIRFSLAQ
ncbi:cell surface protein SprA [Pseudochryseolinea flava]|uniref:Cell surface protein SprA n=2 Tax=Pseudochryseolinea flava TaxID=2059302 RepID=A0A364YAY0_9BACT|nr:cell surface protein SprA [Pseudochryseolinea flava]